MFVFFLLFPFFITPYIFLYVEPIFYILLFLEDAADNLNYLQKDIRGNRTCRKKLEMIKSQLKVERERI